MRLTDTDKEMLDGGQGPVRQKAMELMVRYGRIMEAEEMCQVTWADLFCGCHGYLDVAGSRDFDEIFSLMSLCSKETVRLDAMDPGCICYSGVEADCTERPDRMLMSRKKKQLNQDILSRFVQAGVILSGNCIPYLTGFIPVMGEHFVSCESSAVLFMNSLWGACGNGDGIEASFCAAVCGRTPLAGFHLPENRKATHTVILETSPRTIHDWDCLGHALGKKLPARSIPLITGEFPRPDSLRLKAYFAALACTAGTEMCHIQGITPEAEAAIASPDRNGRDALMITPSDVKESMQALNPHDREKLDYISMGCPHYHIEELRRIAGFLDGKRVHPDTCLDIWTTGPFLYMSRRCGYAETIEKAGANLLTGSCPSSRGYAPGIRTVAYDSAKQRLSAAQETDAKLFYGSGEDCLKSALTGFWEGAS